MTLSFFKTLDPVDVVDGVFICSILAGLVVYAYVLGA